MVVLEVGVVTETSCDGSDDGAGTGSARLRAEGTEGLGGAPSSVD